LSDGRKKKYIEIRDVQFFHGALQLCLVLVLNAVSWSYSWSHVDLKGRNFSSTIYSLSILCLEHH